MSQLGLGVMTLGGNQETVEALTGSFGKAIAAISLSDGENDNQLRITLDDGSVLFIYDDGQSCCESRYMRTDDNLSDYIGGQLLDAELREAPNVKSEDHYGEEHEVQFLVVKTSKGQFVMSNHNEHNGYYGGFAVSARIDRDATEEQKAKI